jgi:formylglycine-generating enzyme required for sulfatase activity
MGTPEYMAPEQAADARGADIRADVYSLGCTLYFLLAGRPPFQADSVLGTVLAHLQEAPRPLGELRPGVPAGLWAVVARMLAKKPEQRYQTPIEVVKALQPFLEAPAKPGATVAPRPVQGPTVAEQKGSPFADLSEASERKPVKKSVKNRAATKAAPAWWRRPPLLAGVGAAVMALVVLAGLWAGGVFKGKTRDGLLVVEVNEPNPEVYVDGDRMMVSWDNGGKKAEIQVKPGTRKVLVKKDGFTVFGEEVTLQEGKRRILVARLSKPLQGEVRGVDKGWPQEIENSIGMHLVRIPPGTFRMGSPAWEKDREPVEKGSEEQHEVEITRAFWLGVHEVTQKQFKAVMGYNPSFFSKDGAGKEGLEYFHWSKPAGGKDKAPADTNAFPVENVSWEEAKEFCEKLSHRAEEKQCGRVYRLPSEAEWEYACRGGAPSYQVFHFGNSLSSIQANMNGHVPYGGAAKDILLKRTCKVGSYEKNRFGLYDMHGNVTEWCSDWYGADYYGKSPRNDPSGPLEGVCRVLRGGGWYCFGQHCRSAYRVTYTAGPRFSGFGFRVALVPSRR